MNKKYTILGLTLVLLLSWAVVTAYYYNQHTVTTKYMYIDGWNFNMEGSKGLQFKQILLVNKKANWEAMPPSDFKMNVIDKIPTNKLKLIVYKVFHFYSKPYVLYENGWALTISGIIVQDYFANDISHEDTPTRVYLELANGERIVISDGGSITRRDDTNILYFNVRRDNVDSGIEPKKLIWNWDKDNEFELELENKTFETKKYSFFDIKPNEYRTILPFYQETLDVYRDIVKGKRIKSELINDSKVLSQFELMREYQDNISNFGNPIYIGDYKGYTNVFAMEIEYVFDISKDNENEKKQTLYFVEESGKWKLIDSE